MKSTERPSVKLLRKTRRMTVHSHFYPMPLIVVIEENWFDLCPCLVECGIIVKIWHAQLNTSFSVWPATCDCPSFTVHYLRFCRHFTTTLKGLGYWWGKCYRSIADQFFFSVCSHKRGMEWDIVCMKAKSNIYQSECTPSKSGLRRIVYISLHPSFVATHPEKETDLQYSSNTCHINNPILVKCRQNCRWRTQFREVLYVSQKL